MLGELVRRRVPQIVGLYLVGSWGFVEFVDWAVAQYVLSLHITNFVVSLLLLLLPSVLLLAWRYGAPGDDRWTRTESIAIPLNLVLAAAVLYLGFRGTPLGAATTTVVVEDESGNAVERVIPRNDFRRSIASFFFDNETGDTTLDWLRYGLPIATEFDLVQDMFISGTSPWPRYGLLRELEEAGFPDGVGVPLALKRKLAADRHLDVFLTGSLVRADSGLVVQSELYDAQRGRLVARHTFSASDPFELADRLSEQLKRDLELPTLQIEEARDLPVSEILTNSVSAFRQYVLGFRSLMDPDIDAAERWLTGAVAEDPSFAMAQWNLAISYYLLNRPEEAAAAAQSAQRYLYKLPERVQFQVRAWDYQLFQQKPEQAFRITRYWVELYPRDIEGRKQLAQLLAERGQWEDQIAQLEEILSIDPTQYEQLQQIGRIYEEQAQYETALGYFERYAELFPADDQSFVAIGDLGRRTGEHERARSAYERALLIEPGAVQVMLSLGRIELDLGAFETARGWADEAMAASRGPEDRYRVYGFEQTMYYRQGLFERLEESYRKRLAAAAEFMIPVGVAWELAESEALRYAHDAGREAFAFRQLDSLRAELPPPFDDAYGAFYGTVIAESGDMEGAQAEFERARSGFTALGNELALGVFAAYESGLVSEQEGDYESAVASYRQTASLYPPELLFAVATGRSQRKLGELEAAEATLQSALGVVPADAKIRYELALVYEDMGRAADAIEQLQAAADVWKSADPAYLPAQKVRAKLRQLGASG